MTAASNAARITPATAQRHENIRNLITLFDGRTLRPHEIGSFLNFTPSGVRKYTKELSEAGVIEIVGMEGARFKAAVTPVYALTASATVRQDYLDALTKRAEPIPKPKRGASSDPSRHMHIMSDDEFYLVKTPKFVARRDPLVEALFGPAGGAQ